MPARKPKKTEPVDLTKLTDEELERQWQEHNRAWGIAQMRMSEISQEQQARRTGRPARQPWPFTEAERKREALEHQLYGDPKFDLPF